MAFAPDRDRFVLGRPIADTPGLRWSYNGGATALLGRIIARGVAAALPDYAKATLFAPLGITTFDWMKGRDGSPSASSGLRLAPRDLARIGQLVVQLAGGTAGRWCRPPGSRRPSGRSSRSTRTRASAGTGVSVRAAVPARSGRRLEPWAGAFGSGGQRLDVVPGLELVVAITAGNYNQPDLRPMPLKLWRDIVLPSLTGRLERRAGDALMPGTFGTAGCSGVERGLRGRGRWSSCRPGPGSAPLPRWASAPGRKDWGPPNDPLTV